MRDKGGVAAYSCVSTVQLIWGERDRVKYVEQKGKLGMDFAVHCVVFRVK